MLICCRTQLGRRRRKMMTTRWKSIPLSSIINVIVTVNPNFGQPHEKEEDKRRRRFIPLGRQNKKCSLLAGGCPFFALGDREDHRTGATLFGLKHEESITPQDERWLEFDGLRCFRHGLCRSESQRFEQTSQRWQERWRKRAS